MRALPIPNGWAEQAGGRRVVIGEPGDRTRDDVRPCEYIVTPSKIHSGRACFTALVELDDAERAAIAEGRRIWLILDGDEVPWSLQVEGWA